jgi:uncharacterized 2Fe-2S/4Fe-4S cluster protein (DUF4445 family)
VQQVVRKAARTRPVDVRPLLRKIYVEPQEATLEAPLADWERLKAALSAADPLTRGPHHLPLDVDRLTIDLPALRALSRTLREETPWALTATVRGSDEVLRVEPGYRDTLVGLAVDVGTTTIAAHLCDLQSGAILATAATMNPQVSYGEDIMSRMSYAADEEDGLETLQRDVLNALNKLARRAARQAGMRATEIVDVVLVGNTAMHHLFLGLDTRALSQAPYVPTRHGALDLRARDVGLTAVNAGAYVHVLPITASFVGADNMGVLLAEAPHRQDEQWLIVDVGTNAELVLGNRERLVCTSTPTGPAFEGAHVEYGIRATDGAIERVEIDPQTLIPRFKVIGSGTWSDAGEDEPPLARGICGSGIIDAVAELYRVGLIGTDGRFKDDVTSPHLRQGEDGPRFVLARAEQTTIGREIPITQEDVRQIQLAKAPLYVAAHYLLHQFGLERPDRILLAGGFGSHIDPAKAMLLGMIPDCPLDRVHSVGNSAGDGAWLALVNRDKRREAADLLRAAENPTGVLRDREWADADGRHLRQGLGAVQLGRLSGAGLVAEDVQRPDRTVAPAQREGEHRGKAPFPGHRQERRPLLRVAQVVGDHALAELVRVDAGALFPLHFEQLQQPHALVTGGHHLERALTVVEHDAAGGRVQHCARPLQQRIEVVHEVVVRPQGVGQLQQRGREVLVVSGGWHRPALQDRSPVR